MTDSEKLKAIEKFLREVGFLLPWCPKCDSELRLENGSFFAIRDNHAICPKCGDIADRSLSDIAVSKWDYRE